VVAEDDLVAAVGAAQVGEKLVAGAASGSFDGEFLLFS